jgi:predicted porin
VSKFNFTIARADRVRDGAAHMRSGLIASVLLAVAGMAQAQAPSSAAPVADESLTWHGITLYGIVDIGVQYDTHGAPISDYFPGGSADIVQKNSNNSLFGVTPSNLSQSRVGLQGKEPLVGDWSAVFKLETFFNPQSGEISDGLKSLVQNNGRTLATQSTNLDTSVAGQAFQQSFAGFSSPSFGTITFGRQNTVLADGIAKYDPEGASQAFSLIGLSGTTAGGGDTQDRRLDESLKYTISSSGVHLGLDYKFANSSAASYATGGSGEAYTAFEAEIGGDYAGFSVDAYYTKIKDAISAAAISVDDFATLPLSYSPNNSLAATVSDNTSYALMALYNLGALLGGTGPTVYAGFEHIGYATPSINLADGFDDIGGYVLAFVNNTAYAKADKVLKVYWTGVKYPLAENFNVTLAYYGYKQDSYATGADAGCSSVVSGACSGTLTALSLATDYRFTKRFDMYAGAMYTNVSHGLANGYINTVNINPTIGVRYSF